MIVELNRIPGMLADAWYGLYFVYNDNYSELINKYNLKVDPDIEKAFKCIKDRLNMDYEFIELFFKNCCKTEEIAAIFPPFTESEFIFQFNSLEDYFNFLDNVEEHTVRNEFVKHLLKFNENETELLHALLTDESLLIEQLDKLTLTPNLKWRALSFIKKPMEAMKEYISLLKEFFYIYESPAFKKHLKKHDAFCNTLEKLNNEEKTTFLKKHMGNYWNSNLLTENTYISILFLNSISAIFDNKESKTFIYIGYKFDEIVAQIVGHNEIDKKLTILKNLSDPTRFKILMLLKTEELYGQQIANKIGITMATISYHMNFLVAGGMVEMFDQGHRTYYKINKSTFIEVSEFIQSTFTK